MVRSVGGAAVIILLKSNHDPTVARAGDGPILAAAGTKDAEWAAVVAWAIHTLQRAEVTTTYWTTGGAKSLPVEADELKLAKDWPQRMVDTVGTYADIYERNLGDGSPYHLPRGPDAAWQNGGILLAPYLD